MISNGIIKISPVSLEYVQDFHEALIESYPEHKEFLEWATENPAIENTTKNMEQAALNFQNMTNELRFIITRESDNKVVGCIGLIIRNLAIPYFEIGYWSRSSSTGQGIMTMAVTLVESYAINKLRAKRLEIKMAASNLASQKVAEKAGFKHEATIHSDRALPSGKVDDTHIYYKIYS